MKTKTFFIFLLLILSMSEASAGVTEIQAKEILKNHFITLAEAKKAYPDLTEELTIPFSIETLKSNRGAWLLPVKTTTGFEYLLIRANFESEMGTLTKVDTLELSKAEEALFLLKKLRPNFPDRAEANVPFKYLFRTKDDSAPKLGGIYKKTVSYDGKNFLIINWPNGVEIGVVHETFISYLTMDKRGVEIQYGQEKLPENFPKINQSVYILTLLRCKV